MILNLKRPCLNRHILNISYCIKTIEFSYAFSAFSFTNIAEYQDCSVLRDAFPCSFKLKHISIFHFEESTHICFLSLER